MSIEISTDHVFSVSIPETQTPVRTPNTTPRGRSKSPRRTTRGRSPRKLQIAPPNMDSVLTLENSKLNKKLIQVGNSQFEYGNNIGEMTDSTQLYRSGDRHGLRKRLNTEGYIYIKGAIDFNRASACRDKILTHLSEKDAFIDNTDIQEAIIKHPKEQGWTVDAETGGFVNDREPDSAIDGWRGIGWSEEVRSVYAGEDLKSLYKFLWGQERGIAEDGFNMLSEVTWLRAKGKGEVTAEHADYYYFKENTSVFKDNRHPYIERDAEVYNEEYPSQFKEADTIVCDLCDKKFQKSTQKPSLAKFCKDDNGEWHCDVCARQQFPLFTCWISLGQYHSGNSSLCVMPRSQVLTEFHNPLKGNLLPQDYNSLVKAKWGWQRGEISIGDIVLFNVKTVHGASKNLTNSFRLSIDTRVSAHWFRPKSMYGDDCELNYNYTDNVDTAKTDEVAVTSDAPVVSGGQLSLQTLPVINNKRVPSTLSIAFLEEKAARDAACRQNAQKKKKIGNMGGGMGMQSNGACESSDDEEEMEQICVKKRKMMM